MDRWSERESETERGWGGREVFSNVLKQSGAFFFLDEFTLSQESFKKKSQHSWENMCVVGGRHLVGIHSQTEAPEHRSFLCLY